MASRFWVSSPTMSTDDDSDDVRPKQVVYDARERVIAARAELHAQREGRGGVPGNVRRELVVATVQYWDILQEFRNQRADDWPEEVDWLEDYIGRSKRVLSKQPGRGGGLAYSERPALMTVPPDRIRAVSRKLDEFANSLGFAAPIRDKTENNKGSMGDLYELLKKRGQDDAAERLPKSAFTDGGEA